MGKVLAVLKIIPEDTNANLNGIADEIKKNLPEKIRYHDSKIEPFAYGLDILRISFIMDDNEGGTDNLESMIKGLEGVGEVEVEHLTLI